MRLFGLIGYPLTHSFSEKHFTDKFLREGIVDCEYRMFPIKSLDEFPKLISSEPNLRGLNVTIPYKQAVKPLLNELDAIALEVGAVNVIKVNKSDGETCHLKGYNTDVFGFQQSLKPFLDSRHERALVLGRGGAAKAVTYVLKQIGIPFLSVGRTQEESGITFKEINKEIILSHPFIINCTPLGTFPKVDFCPPLPYEYISPNHFLYDLVYNPEETLFLKKGKEKGALCVNGLSMLQLQAEKAWEIWNN